MGHNYQLGLDCQPCKNTNINAGLLITQYNYDHVVRSVCFTPLSCLTSVGLFSDAELG